MTQMMDKKRIWHANWSLILFTLLLVGIGLANLYSACAIRLEDGITFRPFYQRQLGFVGIGLGCMVLGMMFDYRKLEHLALPLFILSVILLLLVPLIGREAGGAQRWIPLGFINLQPSELAKIGVMILGAKMLAASRTSLGWKKFFTVLGMGLVPVVLVFAQPDLGTAIIILMILGGMIIFRGLKPPLVKVGIIFILLSPLLIWQVIYPNLKPYQQQRIKSFVDPSAASRDAMFQRNQALIAIGSGQGWGKGWMDGPQNNLHFIREKHTDYAIAVFGEERGFAGSVALVTLFCLFLYSIHATAREAKDRFGSMLCVGVFFYFFWQILINIGMVAGMMPVVGVPLPFFSHGGTAMVVNFSLLGIVLSVSMRRFVFKSA
ncbi:MAG: rod shape-determining protein RodA [Deltaproteobacteria bacterium]|jgi:rod shape determining protein RodA|nr:rod shape-determining protein RodA [Deltaproteobacteria bacterium]